MIQIAPSLLAADFSRLGEELQRVATADMLHLDVMDGHFVPNLSIGPQVVAALRDKSALHFDVHLMLEHPLPYVEAFRRAGADSITFHAECADDPAQVLAAIEAAGARPGMALSPNTPPTVLAPYASRLFLVTVMTVHPGFGGQSLIPAALQKLPWLRANIPAALRQVDGGVNGQTAAACVAAGAQVLVAGTAVFGAADPPSAIASLRT